MPSPGVAAAELSGGSFARREVRDRVAVLRPRATDVRVRTPRLAPHAIARVIPKTVVCPCALLYTVPPALPARDLNQRCFAFV